MAWELKNKKLSKKLHELGLVSDEMGYWFYPPYSTDFWVISSYGDSISLFGEFTYDNGIIIIDVDLSAKYNVEDEDLIIKQAKKLIDDFQDCMLLYKQNQEQKRLEILKMDF